MAPRLSNLYSTMLTSYQALTSSPSNRLQLTKSRSNVSTAAQ